MISAWCKGCASEVPVKSWADTEQDDRGVITPKGPLCLSCNMFCEKRCVSVKEFLRVQEASLAKKTQSPFAELLNNTFFMLTIV